MDWVILLILFFLVVVPVSLGIIALCVLGASLPEVKDQEPSPDEVKLTGRRAFLKELGKGSDY